MTTHTKEQYRERAAAKVAAAQEVLAAEVASLVSGDDWRQFLDLQAHLHDYSANNVMLIFAQHAKAYEEGRVRGPHTHLYRRLRSLAGTRSQRGSGTAWLRGVGSDALDSPGGPRR